MTVRELSGTTAIVTGASKGFGRATAIALAGMVSIFFCIRLVNF